MPPFPQPPVITSLRVILMYSILIHLLSGTDQPVLVWSDEFNQSGAPDPAKWDYEVGLVRNHEAQFYTKARRENAWVEDGNLVITARKEDWLENGKSAKYTSASLRTKDRFEFIYGRVEVRAKIPTGRGTWPAIWFLGTNIGSAGWPACGEIDLMENVGFDPDKIHFTIHTTAFNHVKKTQKGTTITVPEVWKDFHLYALEWRTNRLDFFCDGERRFTFANDGSGVAAWPFDQKMYLILNLAIGGAWGGAHGIDNDIFPQRMLVDYVRVYRLAE